MVYVYVSSLWAAWCFPLKHEWAVWEKSWIILTVTKKCNSKSDLLLLGDWCNCCACITRASALWPWMAMRSGQHIYQWFQRGMGCAKEWKYKAQEKSCLWKCRPTEVEEQHQLWCSTVQFDVDASSQWTNSLCATVSPRNAVWWITVLENKTQVHWN